MPKRQTQRVHQNCPSCTCRDTELPPDDEPICGKKKCGDFNMLECVGERGHVGDHTFVVVSNPDDDYPHNKKKGNRGIR